MDLGTTKRRLECIQFATAHQVAEDIRLVWRNCMAYNTDGLDFWLLAKSLSRRFEDRYRKGKFEFDVGEELCEEDEDDDSDEGESPKAKTPTTKRSRDSSNGNSDGAAYPANGKASLDSRVRFGAMGWNWDT